MMARPPRQPVDLAAVARDLRLLCKRIAGNLDAIAQEQDPLIVDPKTTMLELVLASHEIAAAIERQCVGRTGRSFDGIAAVTRNLDQIGNDIRERLNNCVDRLRDAAAGTGALDDPERVAFVIGLSITLLEAARRQLQRDVLKGT